MSYAAKGGDKYTPESIYLEPDAEKIAVRKRAHESALKAAAAGETPMVFELPYEQEGELLFYPSILRDSWSELIVEGGILHAMHTAPKKVKTEEKRATCLALRLFYMAKLKELRAAGKIPKSNISLPPRPPAPSAGPFVS